MSSIQEIQQEIIEEFEMFDDWMQRYEYMIELGKSLPLIDDKYKTDEYIIKGCQSKVWVHADFNEGNIEFTADSDAIITKGIIAILIRSFSNQSPQAILDADTSFMIKVSEDAKKKIASLMTEDGYDPNTDYVRVGVKSGGCSGLSYDLKFDKSIAEEDKLFEDNNIKLIVDKRSFLYLIGTTLEYSGGLNGKGFVFNNPNAQRTCGCGESFSL